MTDKVSKAIRRKTMQAVKATNTQLEEKVAKELWRRGLRFRKNCKDLFGKPDIAIKKYKIAIFIDSCFWHNCEKHCRIPSTNKNYWIKKLENNKRRDLEVNTYYKSKGWHIRRIWEHDLKANSQQIIYEIERFIRRIKIQQVKS